MNFFFSLDSFSILCDHLSIYLNGILYFLGQLYIIFSIER